MTHTYSYRMHLLCPVVPNTRSSLGGLDLIEVIVSYDTVSVLPNEDLERITRNLLEHLVVQFAYTNGNLERGCFSLSVLSSLMLSLDEQRLSDWVLSQSDLSVHDISSDESRPCVWIIFQ